MTSRRRISKLKIDVFFEAASGHAYRTTDLQSILLQNRETWTVPKSMTPPKFLDYLVRRTEMRPLTLESPYGQIVRYAWRGEPTAIALALSLKPNAFLSHGTALWIHGLAPKAETIYVNQEQSPKPSGGELSQEAIHRAFRNNQRESKLVYKWQQQYLTVLSGKHTGRLGVQLLSGPNQEQISVTSLERSLIDAVVRPSYVLNGVAGVLEAFRVARTRVSVELLLKLLRELKYTYPYHQALGWYLSRASYTAEEQKLVESIGIRWDFYLGHGFKDMEFDRRWRVSVPKHLT